MIDARLEHPGKAFPSMLVTLAGIIIDVRPEQPENVPGLISVMVFGMITESSFMHSQKASSPIFVKDVGMVMEVRSLQPWKE